MVVAPDERVSVDVSGVDALASLRAGLGHRDPCHLASEVRYVRAARLPDGPVTVAVAATRDRETVTVEAWGPGAASAIARATEIVGVADTTHAAFAPSDAVVSRWRRRHPRLRLVRLPWVFDALVPIVLGQRVASRDASWSYRKLVERTRERAPGPFELLLPPSAEQLLETPRWFFTEIGIDVKRASTLVGVARHAKRIAALAAATHDDARALLGKLDGLGPWTIESLMGAVLGDPDAVAVGDYWLPHTVAHALAGEARADDARMLALLEPFRPHRARVIQLIHAAGIGAPRFGPRMPRPHFRKGSLP